VKALIIIPAFNESKVISKVIKSLPSKIAGTSNVEILVIDDASTDNTNLIANEAGAIVIKHIINRGAGAATKTGLEWAKSNFFDIVVTFDADGQHNPEDIQKIIEPILKGKADIVIGSRFKKDQKVPLDRLVLNRLANIFTFIMFGVSSTDSQSGLRAFSKRAIHTINFTMDRMEFSSEILLEAKKNSLKIKEIPTSAIYTNYSLRKGQKNINAFSIITRLLIKLFR